MRWRDKFREGKYGPGGDLKYVENGSAVLKIREIIKSPLITHRQVVNVPAGKEVDQVKPEEMIRPLGFRVRGLHTIVGPYALPSKKDGGARLTVTEGMWEDKRGHKVDGGERRQAEVRFKRKVAERKALREAQGFY